MSYVDYEMYKKNDVVVLAGCFWQRSKWAKIRIKNYTSRRALPPLILSWLELKLKAYKCTSVAGSMPACSCCIPLCMKELTASLMKKLASPMVKWCRWAVARFGVGGMLKRFFKEDASVTSSCWNSDKGADSFAAECRNDHGGVGNVTVFPHDHTSPA